MSQVSNNFDFLYKFSYFGLEMRSMFYGRFLGEILIIFYLIIWYSEPRIDRKQRLYLLNVRVRSAYTLPSPDPTCEITLGLLLWLLSYYQAQARDPKFSRFVGWSPVDTTTTVGMKVKMHDNYSKSCN